MQVGLSLQSVIEEQFLGLTPDSAFTHDRLHCKWAKRVRNTSNGPFTEEDISGIVTLG